MNAKRNVRPVTCPCGVEFLGALQSSGKWAVYCSTACAVRFRRPNRVFSAKAPPTFARRDAAS